MALNFPSAPALNQIFGSWQFDGVKWVTAPAPTSGGWVEAPADGSTYGRRNAQWNSVDAMLAPRDNNAGRNLLHNPGFTIQQRGAGSWTAASNYGPDRWAITSNGDTAISMSIVTLADADRVAIGDEAAQYAMQIVFAGGSAAANYTAFTQRLENVRRLANKSVTVSFWARATSGTPKLSVSSQQVFGQGGSPSTAVFQNLGGLSAALGTTWTRYVFSGSVPSIAAKTFGTTAGTDLHEFDFWLSCPSGNATLYPASANLGVQSGTVQIYGVQLEIGTVLTPLMKRDPADELRLCQRFFQSWAPPPMRGGAQPSVSVATRMAMPLSVPMRAAPTVTILSPLPVWNGVSTTTITGITTNYTTATVLEFEGPTAAAWTATAAVTPCLVYQGAGGVLTLSADL